MLDVYKRQILDTTAGQIAVIDICSTFENAARAGSQTERQPGRPGLNPLRFSEKYTITEKHAQDLDVYKRQLYGLNEENLTEMLRFANAAASMITTRKGALRVMPSQEEIRHLLEMK